MTKTKLYKCFKYKPQNWNISANTVMIFPKYLKHQLRWLNQILQMLQLKTTFDGRRPQNIKTGISEQPLTRSYKNFKLKHGWPLPTQTSGMIQIQDDQNISETYYYVSVLALIWNICFGDQTKLYNTLTEISWGKFMGKPRGNLNEWEGRISAS